MSGDDFELNCIYGNVSWCDKLKSINMLLKVRVISFSLCCEQQKMVDLDIVLNMQMRVLCGYFLFFVVYTYIIYIRFKKQKKYKS